MLEPLVRAHARHLFPALSVPLIYRFIPQEPPASLLELEARYQRLESRTSPAGDELWLNWALRLKLEGQYIGTVQATISSAHSPLIAYELSPDFWGQGYATESCSRVITSLFTDYGVTEIMAEVDTRNLASCKLLERLGFQRILTRERADFFKGEYSDEHTYQLIRNV
jgi:[ribosomal protein S5]-alanine N-acetyltransferase